MENKISKGTKVWVRDHWRDDWEEAEYLCFEPRQFKGFHHITFSESRKSININRFVTVINPHDKGVRAIKISELSTLIQNYFKCDKYIIVEDRDENDRPF